MITVESICWLLDDLKKKVSNDVYYNVIHDAKYLEFNVYIGVHIKTYNEFGDVDSIGLKELHISGPGDMVYPAVLGFCESEVNR